MYSGPQCDQSGPGRDSPQGFAYSLRDFHAVRTGQYPSPHNLGFLGGLLKVLGTFFKLECNCFQLPRQFRVFLWCRRWG